MEESTDELKKQILINEMDIDNLIKDIGKTKNNKRLNKRLNKVLEFYKQTKIVCEKNNLYT